MSSVLFSLPDLYNNYKNWISQNPTTASEFETTIKWISYFIAGRINNSHVVSELVYCLSNLLVLFNDRVINKTRALEPPTSGDTLKLWLTIVEYSEVFFELSANKLWGTTGKWIIIVAVQVFKCISRLYLIYHHKETITLCPPIPVLERRTLAKNDPGFTPRENLESFSFTLKRSGKLVRKVDAAPPAGFRDWKPLKRPEGCDNDQTGETSLTRQQLLAEVIYILKPMAHLATVACFGESTWKPWATSLILDASSLHLYNTCQRSKFNALSPKQRLQLSRRTVVLILYLIRSPFYDRYSKDKLNSLLIALSNNIPLASIICKPLAQYLPFWQSTYFYMWST